MLTYIARRLLLMIPTLFGMTLVVFFAMALGPGGVGGAMMQSMQGNMRGAEAARIRAYYEKRYRVNSPLLVQYGRWLNLISPVGWTLDDNGDFQHFGLKAPSLGESMSRQRPVADLIAESLPITLLLSGVSIPIVYGFGIITGIRAAKNRGKAFDTLFGSTQLGAWSAPPIWVGVMLIGLLANSDSAITRGVANVFHRGASQTAGSPEASASGRFKLFPTAGLNEIEANDMSFLPATVNGQWQRGWLLDRLWHLVLPLICLSYGGSAFISKLVRGSVLENLGADYVRTARAKGVPENVVLHLHVFRNSLLALITVAAAILPALLTGAVIVESIFSIPGMGQLGVDAARYQDREVLLAVTLIGGLITLLSTLLRDMLYAAADPRVKYD